MKTLVIGHGKQYEESGSYRHTPIPKEEWINDEFLSIDASECTRADITMTIEQAFIVFRENSFDRIIDTTGGIVDLDKPRYLRGISKLLKPKGTFYGKYHRCIKE